MKGHLRQANRAEYWAKIIVKDHFQIIQEDPIFPRISIKLMKLLVKVLIESVNQIKHQH